MTLIKCQNRWPWSISWVCYLLADALVTTLPLLQHLICGCPSLGAQFGVLPPLFYDWLYFCCEQFAWTSFCKEVSYGNFKATMQPTQQKTQERVVKLFSVVGKRWLRSAPKSTFLIHLSVCCFWAFVGCASYPRWGCRAVKFDCGVLRHSSSVLNLAFTRSLNQPFLHNFPSTFAV